MKVPDEPREVYVTVEIPADYARRLVELMRSPPYDEHPARRQRIDDTAAALDKAVTIAEGLADKERATFERLRQALRKR